MWLSFCVYRALRELSIKHPKGDRDSGSYSCPCRVYRPPVWPSVKVFRVLFTCWRSKLVDARAFREELPKTAPCHRASQQGGPAFATLNLIELLPSRDNWHQRLANTYFSSQALLHAPSHPFFESTSLIPPINGPHRPVTAFAFLQGPCPKNAGPRRTSRMLLRELR